MKCSNWGCNVDQPREKMLHIGSAWYCSDECFDAQLNRSVRELQKQQHETSVHHQLPSSEQLTSLIPFTRKEVT